MTAKPIIFLSAVSRELKSARQLVANTLTFLGYAPDPQEIFGTEQGDLRGMLRRRIDASVGVVQLLGHSYGAEPSLPDEQFGRVSYTQYEALYAKECGKPVWYLVLAENYPTDPHEPESAELRELQSAYRERILSGSDLYHPATTPAELKVLVHELRHDLPGPPVQPSQLPWHIPARGDVFFGRDVAVEKLAAALRAHRVIVLRGPGGIGKTSLAAAGIRAVAAGPEQPGPWTGGAHLHDYYQQPGHIAALTSLLEQSGEKIDDQKDPDATVRRLFSQPGRLVYLEGCEKAERLGDLLKLLGGATVLLTTRNAEHDTLGHPLEVLPIDVRPAAQIIHAHAEPGEQHTPSGAWRPWKELAEALGGHPLACERAGRTLHLEALSPIALQRDLEARGLRAVGERGREHECVFIQLKRDADRLAERAPEALLVWHVLSLGAVAPIPVAPVAAGAGLDEERTRDLLKELRRLGLAHPKLMPAEQLGATEPGWLLTHALVGEFGRRDLPAGAFSEADATLRWWEWWYGYMKLSFDDRTMPGGEARYTALALHFGPMAARLEATGCGGLVGLAVGHSLVAMMHRLHGRYAAALPFSERTLALAERHHGPEHAHTLTYVNNLAVLLQTKGDLVGAEPLYRRAMEGCERVQGLEHPNTLASVNNLAELLRAKGDLTGAEPLYRRALAGYERTLGLEHQATLISVNNLAELLRTKGDLAGAEPLYRRALVGYERTLGLEHPNTLIGMHNLAGLLRDKGDLAGADSHYRRALAGQERVLGPGHPDTCSSAFSLARFLHENSRDSEIGGLARQAYEGWRQCLGDGHERMQAAAQFLRNLGEEP